MDQGFWSWVQVYPSHWREAGHTHHCSCGGCRFRVHGLVLWVQGQGLGSRVQVSGPGFRVQGSGPRSGAQGPKPGSGAQGSCPGFRFRCPKHSGPRRPGLKSRIRQWREVCIRHTRGRQGTTNIAQSRRKTRVWERSTLAGP